MNAGTFIAIEALMKADVSIPTDSRKRLLAYLRAGGEPTTSKAPPSIIRRKAAAQRLSKSLRSVDGYIASGLLKVIRVPGKRRSLGIASESLDALIAGK
jgi:hypothetical protein